MMRFYALVFAAVAEFGLIIIVSNYAGRTLDEKLGENRWATILTVVGLVGAFIRATFTSLKLLKDETKKDQK